MGKEKDSSSVRKTSDAASDKVNKAGSIKSIDEEGLDLHDGDEPSEAQQLENELAQITVSSPVIAYV